jgi:hypothetical protein
MLARTWQRGRSPVDGKASSEGTLQTRSSLLLTTHKVELKRSYVLSDDLSTVEPFLSRPFLRQNELTIGPWSSASCRASIWKW